MSVTLRRAHEKANPLSGVLRGRRRDVPLDIYYALDDMTQQITGLRKIVGAARTEVSRASTGEPPKATTASPRKVVVERNVVETIPYASLSFLQAARTAEWTVTKDALRIRKVELYVETVGFAMSAGIAYATANGASILTTAAVKDFGLQHQQTVDITNFIRPDAYLKVWLTDTVFQFGFTRAGGWPNTRVQVFFTYDYSEEQVI